MSKESFNKLITKSREVMIDLPDGRKQSNATKYSMGALSVFIMQYPSFLSHQQRLAKHSSGNNFSQFFGCKDIPSPNQIRNL